MEVIVALTILTLLYFVYLGVYISWETKITSGNNYYGAKESERKEIKRKIRKHIFFTVPFLNLTEGKLIIRFASDDTNLIGKIVNLKKPPTMKFEGVAGPSIISSKKSFEECKNYKASEDDVFIVTQMKCGTTWMQQIVFEILHHGKGDLSDDGYRTMYNLSPWIECSPKASVPLSRAPLVSEYKKRIIKTHMPERLTAYSEAAKYIYVMRHPAACYASAADFIEFMAGPMSPNRKNLLNWYCSDDMFWGDWPSHVSGWHKKSTECSNILFLSFESLKNNYREEVIKIAKFLEVALTDSELDLVLEKADYKFMNANSDKFEMGTPSIFSLSAGDDKFFKSGKSGTKRLDNKEDAKQIMSYCRKKLKNTDSSFFEQYEEPASRH